MITVTKDARVQSAIANWAPRFVANGIDMNDFQSVTARVERWDEWFEAWFEMGGQHEKLAEDAFKQGRFRSAATHYVQASITYHFGKYLFVHDRERLRKGTERSVACYRKGLPLFSPPGLAVEIPFEGLSLPGYLRFPPQTVRPPVVVMVAGLDSTKEEMHNYEELLLARGLATLAFDGPGQGESEFRISIRADYEKAIAAVIDFLETRSEVDAARVGLMGISLGGYYVCRGAAAESRARAVVEVAGPYCFGAHWQAEPPLTRQAFLARSGAGSEEEAERLALACTLEGVADAIKCPILVVHGKLDRVIPVEEAYRIFEQVAGPKELLILDEGNHVCNNLPYRYRPYVSDWLSHALQRGVEIKERQTG